LEFGDVGFFWREENRRTRRKTLGARGEPIINSTHIWHRAGIELGGRRALSPLRHPCSLMLSMI